MFRENKVRVLLDLDVSICSPQNPPLNMLVPPQWNPTARTHLVEHNFRKPSASIALTRVGL